MPYDEERWKAARDAWRLQWWFERALSGEMGYPQDRHLEEAEVEPEFPAPPPEPVLVIRPCCGCGVEYILSTFHVKYHLGNYPPGLLCDECSDLQMLKCVKGELRESIEYRLRAKADRDAAWARRRAAAARKRAIRQLAETLRRIAAKRAADGK